MKTSLLTPACVLLCLATPLAVLANDSVATQPRPGAVASNDDNTAIFLPTGVVQPTALATPRLTLNQALRAANLSAPSLKPAAEWLARFGRLGRNEEAKPQPSGTPPQALPTLPAA